MACVKTGWLYLKKKLTFKETLYL